MSRSHIDSTCCTCGHDNCMHNVRDNVIGFLGVLDPSGIIDYS